MRELEGEKDMIKKRLEKSLHKKGVHRFLDNYLDLVMSDENFEEVAGFCCCVFVAWEEISVSCDKAAENEG